MKIYNTLSRKKEEIKSKDGKTISYYTCGPTVYDFAHIGNLRSFIAEDILRRALEMSDFVVNQTMNITDIDDKTISASGGKKEEFKKITHKFQKSFFIDLEKLNIKKANHITFASRYIRQIVEFIEELLKKDFAYKSADGSVYFSVDKFKQYGKLSHLDKREIKDGARVCHTKYDKKTPADFVLWKAYNQADGEIYWQTSLGKGRPGWHIECSTMSQDTLGKNIDIHAGGVDLIFPHHENEIAQSEARSGEKFVNYWFHIEHLLVDSKKMSKSKKNYYILSDLEKRTFSPLDFRYLCLQSHYRSKINFTWEALEGAQNARARLKRITGELEAKSLVGAKYQDDHSELIAESIQDNKEVPKRAQQNKQNSDKYRVYRDKFIKVVADDLNIPEALAVVWEVARDKKISDGNKYQFVKWADEKLLALDLFKKEEQKIPLEVLKLAEKRDQAKTDKNFALSDEIRDKIENRGYKVEDTSGGSKIVKK